jgi:ABC-type nitrate/sulfonate/bicarbonate transport system permease component
MRKNSILVRLQDGIGRILLALLWIFLCYGIDVPERYLPRPAAVFGAILDIDPPLYVHVIATMTRIITGTIAGTICGVVIAIVIATYDSARRLILPSVLALRAVPPIASVPFFLLWFGFSEWGKFLLVSTGIGLNIVVAAIQILEHIEERFAVALASFNKSLRSYPISVCLPLVLQSLLPTLRTSVAIIFGASLVAELLGSQVGLGYLIQTSRTTYSMHVVFLVTLILGVLASVLDWMIIGVWELCIFWVAKPGRKPLGSAEK